MTPWSTLLAWRCAPEVTRVAIFPGQLDLPLSMTGLYVEQAVSRRLGLNTRRAVTTLRCQVGALSPLVPGQTLSTTLFARRLERGYGCLFSPICSSLVPSRSQPR